MNDLSSNPMLLDTPIPFVVGPNPNPSVVFASNVKVRGITYSGYSTATNKAIIKDRNGKIVAELTGTTDLQEVRTTAIGWVNGLCADTIQGNGVVLVYID